MSISVLSVIFFALSLLAPQVPEGQAAPLGKVELLCLFDSEAYESRVMKTLARRGRSFEPDDAYLQMYVAAGATQDFVNAVCNTRIIKTPEPSAGFGQESRSTDDQVLQHIARAAELRFKRLRPFEAEAELRDALRIDPKNAFIHLDLGTLMYRLARSGEELAELREAVRLDPSLVEARLWLAARLETRGKLDEAESELRVIIGLEPDNGRTHRDLASVLEKKGDNRGATEEKQIAEKLSSNEGAPRLARIRASGQVMGAKLISHPGPVYPVEAKKAGIEGTVRLEVLIGKDGAIKDLVVLSGDPVLARAAVDAVWRWEYRPTSVNRVPVEVITEVDVNFALSR